MRRAALLLFLVSFLLAGTASAISIAECKKGKLTSAKRTADNAQKSCDKAQNNVKKRRALIDAARSRGDKPAKIASLEKGMLKLEDTANKKCKIAADKDELYQKLDRDCPNVYHEADVGYSLKDGKCYHYYSYYFLGEVDFNARKKKLSNKPKIVVDFAAKVENYFQINAGFLADQGLCSAPETPADSGGVS